MKYYLYIDGEAYQEVKSYQEALDIMLNYNNEFQFLEIRTMFPKKIEVCNDKFKYDLKILRGEKNEKV